ncbi:hypothetical protein E5N77_08935 [Streptomyces sp. SS52]|nr:hypothetical protein DBP22_11100 [Streptomyces sp. CS207]QCB21927.1 hypothetical protein E5N77_08935 [Streptomyces sp. SS52]QCR46874.1 hypothetical protein C1N79_09235 [Streptomyces sp. SGAir0924]RSS11121.1 hypothetical protein EF915_26510 [Streptomyces sp. WAC08401]RSS70824.1 hypothetical protein EF907_00270 [Streptomyces sp. WAC06273]RSS74591.1 hypothetical protein EF911_17630 [Streptomyces sp. WAC06128]RSS86510.1 hypothetical protein EF919_36475 [Streptomyces sp. WAC02707]
MIHHLCEISSSRGVSYTDFAAGPPSSGARPRRLSDLELRGETRSAVRTRSTGIPHSVCGDPLLSSPPCLIDLAEWVAMRAGRGDHEETRAHFP